MVLFNVHWFCYAIFFPLNKRYLKILHPHHLLSLVGVIMLMFEDANIQVPQELLI